MLWVFIAVPILLLSGFMGLVGSMGESFFRIPVFIRDRFYRACISVKGNEVGKSIRRN